MPNKII